MEVTFRGIIARLRAEMLKEVADSNTQWLCTSCYTCGTHCPRQINLSNLSTELRSIKVYEGFIPKTLQDALMGIQRYGNPWGQPDTRRSEWAEGLGVKDFSKGDSAKTLLFTCCTPAYDQRNQNVVKSLVSILQKAGVDFAILGNEEKCCGDSIRRIGEKALFEMLVEENNQTFNKYGIEQIVTISPHCMNTFKKDYGSSIQVQHYTQLLSDLVDTEKLTFSKKLEKVVTYHDPCFLGRQNNVYDEPRRILEAIPGLSFEEMRRTRENSFCCGGGGGRMWMEEENIKPETRPCVRRATEAASLHPDILATACPYCTIMLEDGVKSIGMDQNVIVRDIAELVEESM